MTTRYDGGLNRYVFQDGAVPVALTQRTRVTLAELNAGKTLLPAVPGFKYRLIDAKLIAVGGAAAVGTSVNVIGTRAAAPVQLLVVLIAALTQSAVVRAGAANAAVLANGASFESLDANTGITVITVGTAMTTLTHLDVDLTFEIVE